jgi:hypothetical protein
MQLRILKLITKYDILSTEQYGFRTGLKTDNAIYTLTPEILNAVNNKLLMEVFSVIWRKHSIVLIMVSYYLN